jgi:hypothetical protein
MLKSGVIFPRWEFFLWEMGCFFEMGLDSVATSLPKHPKTSQNIPKHPKTSQKSPKHLEKSMALRRCRLTSVRRNRENPAEVRACGGCSFSQKIFLCEMGCFSVFRLEMSAASVLYRQIKSLSVPYRPLKFTAVHYCPLKSIHVKKISAQAFLCVLVGF